MGLLISTSCLGQNENIDLTGVIDMHVHAGPDSRPRAMNDWEAVQMAENAGLRGVLLKNHFTMTADRAALAAQLVDNLLVFGGVALNRSVGGINPEAVRQMAAFSGGRGKVVWLPTFDSQFFVNREGITDPFVPVMKDGRPVGGLLEVFSLIAQNNLVLAMGHSSPQEVLALIPFARAKGVENILITHVFGQDASFSQIQQMAATGAIMELDWLAAYTDPPILNEYVEVIQSVGAESFIISSDFGQEGNPDHASGMRAFIAALRSREISQQQIDVMAKQNPAKLLGLD
jgi:predicted metal-dependent TIM-barrel fold hydrolase|tara:strand:- start:1058 stop:1921 length:864 start_codon:yes stop_codon:yes gene_type:complete